MKLLDEGYGNFNLFTDKQLQAEIESNSRNLEEENSRTFYVSPMKYIILIHSSRNNYICCQAQAQSLDLSD